MKIYLTEMEQHGKKFAGPNIVAETLQEAEEAAEANGLTLLGEFVEIVTEDGLMHYLEPEGYNKEKGVTLIEFFVAFVTSFFISYYVVNYLNVRFIMPKKTTTKKKKSTVNKAGNYTKPTMRKRLFNKIKAGSKGGKPGQWSARKAQMLAKQYKAAGGGYK